MIKENIITKKNQLIKSISYKSTNKIYKVIIHQLNNWSNSQCNIFMPNQLIYTIIEFFIDKIYNLYHIIMRMVGIVRLVSYFLVIMELTFFHWIILYKMNITVDGPPSFGLHTRGFSVYPVHYCLFNL